MLQGMVILQIFTQQAINMYIVQWQAQKYIKGAIFSMKIESFGLTVCRG